MGAATGALLSVAMLAAGAFAVGRQLRRVARDSWSDFLQSYLTLDDTGDRAGVMRRAEVVVYSAQCSEEQRELALAVLAHLRRRSVSALA